MKFLKKFRKGQKGFTLIELLVVIAILGVIAAVAVPNILSFIGEGNEEAAAAELHNVTVAVTAALASSTATPPACVTYTAVGIAPNTAAAANDPAKYLVNRTVYAYTVTSTGTVTQGAKYTWP